MISDNLSWISDILNVSVPNNFVQQLRATA